MLRKIGLANFKSWRSLELDLAPITLLFGTNSSGKTSVLESLLLLKQTVNSRDPNTHLNFGGGPRDYVDFGSYEDLVYEHDKEKPIGISLSWKEIGGIFFTSLTDPDEEASFNYEGGRSACMSYEVGWIWQDDILLKTLKYAAQIGQVNTNDSFYVNISRLENGRHTAKLPQWIKPTTSEAAVELPLELALPRVGALDVPGNCYMVPHLIIPDVTDAKYVILPKYFNQEFEYLMLGVNYMGPLRVKPKRLYLFTGENKTQIAEPDGVDAMAALISSARGDGLLHDRVSASLRELGLVDAFALRPVDERRRLYEPIAIIDDKESALLDVGFGVSQVLPVITLLFSAPEGSILLLEQPELHLHPSAQAALADLMLHVAETRNLQLIVESHSEHLLRRFQRRIAERETDFAKPENIKAYFCNPSPEGLVADEVLVDRFGQISNWPDNFFGDIGGDLHNMARAALKRRAGELELAGNRS